MTTFSYIFYPKKPKAYSKGLVPIYLRITVRGKRAEVSIKKMVDPEKWNPAGSKMKGSTEEVKKFNGHLNVLASKLNETYHELLAQGVSITAELLKNKFLGVEEKKLSLLEVVSNHNNNIEALVGNGYSNATLTKYNTTMKHLTEFIKWKYKISDLSVDKLSYEFLADFEFYLKSKKAIAQNTTAKYIKNTKKIIYECVQKGWLKMDPFASFQIKTPPTVPTFLFDYELEAIQNKVFKIERIAKVRDMFVFSCYTGLSFIDAYNLTSNNISIGIDGEKWIFTNRQKNNQSSPIPLLPQALEIINKYKDDADVINKGKLLPILSNQKMNAYLKEIADLCGLNKKLTYHVARHTFATTVTISNGVPIESVQKMLGHNKIQTTQHYAKVINQKLSKDMQTLRSKLSPALDKKATG